MKRPCLTVSTLSVFLAAVALDAVAAEPTQPAVSEQTVTIKLPVSSWNIVLQGLGELQLKTAIPVLQDIQAQSAPQLKPPAPPEPLKQEPKR